MTATADIIFYGGDIITMEEPGGTGGSWKNPRVEAVAVGGGIILAVGSLVDVSRFVCTETKTIFLNRHTLMPGFIECHQHAMFYAIGKNKCTVIDSAECSNFTEVSEVMRKRLSELQPGEWAHFFGWDPELVRGLPTLRASYLDGNFSSTKPIVIIGQNAHVAWANSAAMEAIEMDGSTPDIVKATIERESSGKPTGKFIEPNVAWLLGRGPNQSMDIYRNKFEVQWRYYSTKGFTTVTELAYRPSDQYDTIIKELADRPDCPIRLALYRVGRVTNYEKLPETVSTSNEGVGRYNDKLWEAGVKLFADGSPHCGTMATREPFMHTSLTEILHFPKAPNYGILRQVSEELVSTIKHYHKKGAQIAIHSHGERASEQVITAYEQVLGELGSDDRRHRMEHCGLTTVDQLARAAKLDLALSFFVDHLRYYGLIFKTDIFGDRVNRWTPLSEATRLGLTWTIHQDSPCFPGGVQPFANMKTAVTRCTKDDPHTPYGPEYRVSINEALKAYTVNGAWQLHREKELGTIMPGKRADLVVLSKNPYEVDPFDLESIGVVETYLDGRSNGLAKITTLPGTDINILQPGNIQ